MFYSFTRLGKFSVIISSNRFSIPCLLSSYGIPEFFGETSNHPGNSAPLQPRFDALWLLAFPQNKFTFEREEISDRWWDSGKYNGAAVGNWENCPHNACGPELPTLKGTGASLSCVQCFLYLISSSINVSIFHITSLDTFWTNFVYSSVACFSHCIVFFEIFLLYLQLYSLTISAIERPIIWLTIPF